MSIILAEAFWRLRKCGGNKYSINTQQIILQLAANVPYAVANTVFMLVSGVASWYCRLALDWCSLLALTYILVKIADL